MPDRQESKGDFPLRWQGAAAAHPGGRPGEGLAEECSKF